MRMSDLITQRILQMLDESADNITEIQRNEFATLMGCVPSQINYVLSTRFTLPKGYIIESQRGGGGFIRLVKVNLDRNDYINELLTETLNADIDYSAGIMILDNLVKLNVFDKMSAKLLGYAITSKALAMPVRIENKQRANILKSVLVNYMKERR